MLALPRFVQAICSIVDAIEQEVKIRSWKIIVKKTAIKARKMKQMSP